jgi:hypothetical protein
MSTAKSLLFLLIVGIAALVSGCGLTVPDMQNFGGDQDHEEADENLILNHIKCEIHAGVQTALYDPRFFPPSPTTGKSVDWLRSWGAKVSYVLTADEKSSLNPGLGWKNPFEQMGTFQFIGGGLQSSAEAQRKETGAVTYAFVDLMKEPPIKDGCADQNGILIHSNLRIAEFISNKVFVTRVPGTVPNIPVSIDSAKSQILNAFSDEITFTVIYGGNVTPSWFFVRLSVNPTSPLFNGMRTKIQYVTITLGPVQVQSTATTAAQLGVEAQLLDSANLTGHAVASALLNITPPVTTTPPVITIAP